MGILGAVLIFITVIVVGYFTITLLFIENTYVPTVPTGSIIKKEETDPILGITSDIITTNGILNLPRLKVTLQDSGVGISGPNATLISDYTLINLLANIGSVPAFYTLATALGTDSNAAITKDYILDILSFDSPKLKEEYKIANIDTFGNLTIPIPVNSYYISILTLNPKQFASYVIDINSTFWITSDGEYITVIRTDKYEKWNQSFTVNINTLSASYPEQRKNRIFVPSSTLPIMSFYKPIWAINSTISDKIIITPKGTRLHILSNPNTSTVTVLNINFNTVGWDEFGIIDGI